MNRQSRGFFVLRKNIPPAGCYFCEMTSGGMIEHRGHLVCTGCVMKLGEVNGASRFALPSVIADGGTEGEG